MCIGMNGDTVAKGHYSVSTSNRNFEGRQGAGARTLLASPLTAAASAVRGTRDRSARTDERLSHGTHQYNSLVHASSCRPATSTPTRSFPARFLTTTTREGLGKQLFNDWRYHADGSDNPDFILNRPEAKGCRILVAGRNFGCGSSREHAPWALHGLTASRR